jgi:hypothetical protein
MVDTPIFHIFGDETCHTGHPFLVYGTMDCPRENLPTIRGLLTEALKNRREFKWSGELSRDLDGFVDTIFKCRAKHGLSFRCMVVNTRHSNHNKYNEGDPLLGLEKYIFYHLLGYARRLRHTPTSGAPLCDLGNVPARSRGRRTPRQERKAACLLPARNHLQRSKRSAFQSGDAVSSLRPTQPQLPRNRPALRIPPPYGQAPAQVRRVSQTRGVAA